MSICFSTAKHIASSTVMSQVPPQKLGSLLIPLPTHDTLDFSHTSVGLCCISMWSARALDRKVSGKWWRGSAMVLQGLILCTSLHPPAGARWTFRARGGRSSHVCLAAGHAEI